MKPEENLSWADDTGMRTNGYGFAFRVREQDETKTECGLERGLLQAMLHLR
jgi:hypothetical protein